MAVLTSHCKIQRSGQERQLVATRDVAEGDVVLLETPLFSVPLGRYAWQTYSWELVSKLLEDPTLLKQYQRLKLKGTPMLLDPVDLAVEARMVAAFKKSRSLVHELIYSVGTNNVGILNQSHCVVGYGIYEVLSFSDHSCEPSTRLTPANAFQGQACLVASRDIRKGEAITWSYFREAEFLGADFYVRNFGLVNVFRFVCRCERCRRELPEQLRAEKNLLAYFDKLIAEEAKELLATRGGLKAVMDSAPMAQHHAALTRKRGLG